MLDLQKAKQQFECSELPFPVSMVLLSEIQYRNTEIQKCALLSAQGGSLGELLMALLSFNERCGGGFSSQMMMMPIAMIEGGNMYIANSFKNKKYKILNCECLGGGRMFQILEFSGDSRPKCPSSAISMTGAESWKALQ